MEFKISAIHSKGQALLRDSHSCLPMTRDDMGNSQGPHLRHLFPLSNLGNPCSNQCHCLALLKKKRPTKKNLHTNPSTPSQMTGRAASANGRQQLPSQPYSLSQPRLPPQPTPNPNPPLHITRQGTTYTTFRVTTTILLTDLG